MTTLFDNMPDEVILIVARALGRASDVVRLASTCWRYHILLRDDTLWRHLCLAHFGPPLHEGFADAGKSWQWLYRAQGSNARLAGVSVGAIMTPGRIYWGDVLDGLPHGYGLSIALPTKHRNGRALRRRRHDCDLDDGTPRHDGYWICGRAHGYGVRVYRNGSRYRGMWCDDMHHGYGERTDAQGWIYVGEWHNGHTHGKGPCKDSADGAAVRSCGVHYDISGPRHLSKAGRDGDDATRLLSSLYPAAPAAPRRLWNRADFEIAARQNPCPSGGTLLLPDGAVYMRERDGDLIRGTVTWPDGRRFRGCWSDWSVYNEITAVGVMTYRDGRVCEGAFRGGLLRGPATVTYPDGTRVESVWYGDRAYDTANVSWPDGRRYKGSWLNGLCHGYGEMTWPDGSHWAGAWIDGRPDTAATPSGASPDP